MKIDKIEYSHYGNCLRLTNGTVDVVVTTDLGPRVIFYGFSGGTNILGELGPDVVTKTELGDWRPFGGHRLWASPESMPRTYSPDIDPVEVDIVGDNAVRLTQAVEPATHLQKEMLITLDADGTRVTVDHKITNTGLWPIQLAPWALTIMNSGGTTILPQEPFIAHGEVFLPARPLVLWNYTNLGDPRWIFGEKYLRLRTDSGIAAPQKIGALDKLGWAGYLRDGELFVKRFPYVEGAEYPDFGCNFETFTAGDFMEVETLGPTANIEPSDSVSYTERWFLFKGVDAGETEDSLDAAITPLVAETRVGG